MQLTEMRGASGRKETTDPSQTVGRAPDLSSHARDLHNKLRIEALHMKFYSSSSHPRVQDSFKSADEENKI